MINLIDHYIPDLRPFSSIFFVISKRDRLAKKKKKIIIMKRLLSMKVFIYHGFLIIAKLLWNLKTYIVKTL